MKTSIFFRLLVSTLVFCSFVEHASALCVGNAKIESWSKQEIKASDLEADAKSCSTPRERGELLEAIWKRAGNEADRENSAAFLSCRIRSWQLPNERRATLEEQILKVAQRVANDRDLFLSFPVCGYLNQSNGYFEGLVHEGKRLKSLLESGQIKKKTDVNRRLGSNYANQKIELLKGIEKRIDEFLGSARLQSKYPLRNKVRLAMFHAQNAALADDDKEMRAAIWKAVDELEEPLKDIEKFNNTVRGWKAYSDLRMLALLYRAVLADQASKESIKKLYNRRASVRKIVSHRYQETFGDWPSVYELKNHQDGQTYGESEMGWHKVELLEADEVRMPANYVDMIFLERLFPFAQLNDNQSSASLELKGWKRRSYKPGDIVYHAWPCVRDHIPDAEAQVTRSVLRAFDKCFIELEATDWSIQFESVRVKDLRRNKEGVQESRSYLRRREDLAKKFLNDAKFVNILKKDAHPFARERQAIERQRSEEHGVVGYKSAPWLLATCNASKRCVMETSLTFSTTQIDKLRKHLTGSRLKSLRLGPPLFKRPKLL